MVCKASPLYMITDGGILRDKLWSPSSICSTSSGCECPDMNGCFSYKHIRRFVVIAAAISIPRWRGWLDPGIAALSFQYVGPNVNWQSLCHLLLSPTPYYFQGSRLLLWMYNMDLLCSTCPHQSCQVLGVAPTLPQSTSASRAQRWGKLHCSHITRLCRNHCWPTPAPMRGNLTLVPWTRIRVHPRICWLIQQELGLLPGHM